MKIGTGVQGILRLRLRNLRGIMVVLLMRGFINYVEMGSRGMTYIIHNDQLRHSKVVRGDTHTDNRHRKVIS
jgi:hypothetical protein